MNATLYSIFSSLPFCLCLFWWLILLIRRDTVSSPAHRFLSLFALNGILLYFCHASYFNGEEIPFLRVVYYGTHLAAFPLFWLYIRALTEPERLKLRAGWVLAPSLGVSITLLVFLACGKSPDSLDLLVQLIYLGQLVLISVSVVRRLTVFDRRVKNFYVDTEHKSLQDLRSLFFLLIPLTVFSAIGGAVGRSVFVNRPLLILPSLLFSALLFGIFHVGFLLEYTAAEMAGGGPELPSQENEDDKEQHALLNRVRHLMESQRIYLTPGLKISDVAESLDTNRTYISACINRQTGMSFSDYVNGFRIRYAQELMRGKGADLTLTQIGIQSGFSGDTSFFRNFKKVTGQTPSEWLSSQKEA
jgi:AraC-like DNA-binding protein